MAHAHRTSDRRRLLVVLGLTLTVLAVEIVGGLLSGSLALLADAAHVFTDAAGILFALGAMWLATRAATEARSYGWYRAEIVAAAFNALLLFGVSVLVLWEAWRRLSEPAPITTGLMLVVAVAGLLANLVGVRLLREGSGRSLNMRGAYLEVVADLAGSIAVIIAAVVIQLTGSTAADAIASAIIAILIVPRTVGLLREALDVLLEATPRGIRLADVRAHIVAAPGVRDVHDLHAWTITSGLNVVSAHVIVDEDAEPSAVLDHLCRCLSDTFDIEHSTFQLETADRRRLEEVAHA